MAIINGTNADNFLWGTSGDDVITGLQGSDNLIGGAGSDTYVFSEGDGDDFIYADSGSGFEVIQFNDIASTDVTVRRQNHQVTLSYSGGSVRFQLHAIQEIRFSDQQTWTISYNARPKLDAQLTNNPELDGLLSGYAYHAPDQQRLTMTFGFPDFTGNNETESDRPIYTASAAYQAAVRDQLSKLSELTNIDFVEVTDPQAARFADISFAGMKHVDAPSGVAGYAYYPGNTSSMIVQRDENNTDYSIGGSYYQVLLHEIGHRLGLKHSHDEENGFPELPEAKDNAIYTVMSYNWNSVVATTYAVLDIQALQYLYGANYQTRSGNDTYTYNLNTGWYNETIWDGGGEDAIHLEGTSAHFSLEEGVLNPNQHGYGSVTIAYGANIENLVGTSGNDVLTGNHLDNRLTGSAGDDLLYGGLGHDILVGSGGRDSIYGGAGNDVLDGGFGVDVMYGGQGNDVYHVNHSADKVIELTNEGVDTVHSSANYQLSAHVENLVMTAAGLTGIGNVLSNVLTAHASGSTLYGGGGRDTLNGGAGNDVLDGGFGVDVMYGGQGDDVYHVNHSADKVIESANEGTDTVHSSANYQLSAHVENLVLTAAGLTGTGNVLSNVLTAHASGSTLYGGGGRDTLNGGAGNDVLDGGFGVDVMYGGQGDDVYHVNHSADKVIELFNQGNDTINSTVNWTLEDHVENLSLLGVAHLHGTGNALDNMIAGNSGNNILRGAGGQNMLIGGAGNDTYLLERVDGISLIQEAMLVGSNDHILFGEQVAEDQIWFSRVGNDLQAQVIGTTAAVQIDDWYTAGMSVERFVLSSGETLMANQVEALVSAMSGLTPPALGQTSLSQQQQNVLSPVLASSWA
ncbi:MAG: matrixin family metalloprotease [Pseudomonadota bacterium]|nr:matrixin family metalloprotease [Pseudomonadota bacterium]